MPERKVGAFPPELLPIVERQAVLNYPADGTVRSVSGGRIKLNFVTGKVLLPDGTLEEMSSSLQGLGIPFARSVFIWITSDDSSATFNPGGSTFHVEPCASFTFDDSEITDIFIDLPTTRIPDEHKFYMVASNRKIGFNPTFLNLHHDAVNTLTTTDSQQTIILKHTVNFSTQTFKVKNTGSNSVDVDLQLRELAAGTFDSANGFPITVAAGDTEWIIVKEAHHITRLRVISTAPGNSTDVTVEWLGKT